MLHLLLATAAQAAPFLQPVVGVVPPSGAVGDGSTPVQVYVIARAKDGSPIEGSTLRSNAKLGRTGPLEEVGGGVYTFLWTPPKAETPTTETLIVKGKTPDKRQIDLKVPVPLQMEAPYKLQTSSSPADIIATTTAHATVTLDQGTWGADPAVRACGGELSEGMALDEGVHKLRYTIGKQYTPRLAIITASDNAAQLPTYGYHLLPLLVARTETAQVEPYSQVAMRVGAREFGPIKASSSGRASVPVAVPPGLATADLISVSKEGVVSRDTHALEQKESQQICLFPPPASIPVDTAAPPKIRVVVLKPDGTPDVNAKPKLTASAGKIGEILPVRDGIFEAAFTPPERAQTVTFEATLGDSSTQRDRVTTKVIAAKTEGEARAPISSNPPAAIVLVSDGVVVKDTSLSIDVVAVDAWGHPVAGAAVELKHDSAYAELVETVTTDRYGRATVDLKAGSREELFTVHAQSGAARGAMAVITALEPIEGGVTLPISGDRDRVAIETWWRDALAD